MGAGAENAHAPTPQRTYVVTALGRSRSHRKAPSGSREHHVVQRLMDDAFEALDEQTTVVPGTGTLDIVVPALARSLAAVHEQRRALEAQINALLEAPLLPRS